jgi:glycosyltransferase involved in cell wall biosynthesis
MIVFMCNNLLIITPGFPSDESDTACLPAQQALISCIHELYPSIQLQVFALNYPFRKSAYLWHGIPVTAFQGGYSRLQCLLLRRRIIRYIRKTKLQPEAVLSFWLGEAALTGQQIAGQLGIPHKTWVLGQDAKPGNRYAKHLIAHAENWLPVSDAVAALLRKHYQVHTGDVLPNAVNPADFPPMPAQRDIDIIGTGSLIPLKRYDIFLRVTASIRKKYPLRKVMLCGAGPEKASLEQLCRQLALDDIVVFTGELPHSEILSLMQRSRLLLHPSSYEGFSGVCLEALYAGSYVISFTQPQEGWIRNWQIVSDEEEMTTTAYALLAGEPVAGRCLPYHMHDTAHQLIRILSSHAKSAPHLAANSR